MDNVHLTWDPNPDTSLALANEVSGGAFSADDAEPDRWPRLGVVIARENDTLLGWVQVWAVPDRPGVAHAQEQLADQMKRRLAKGYYDMRPFTAADKELVASMFEVATDQGRAAGYDTLIWSGMDTDPAGTAANRLGATAVREVARVWSAELPGDSAASAGDSPQEITVSVDLPSAASAQVTAVLLDGIAYVNAGEALHPNGATTSEIAGLFDTLLAELSGSPGATRLSVFEFDEDVRRGLDASRLQVSGRMIDYELAL